MAQLVVEGSNGHHYFELNVFETSYDISSNSSEVYYSLNLDEYGGTGIGAVHQIEYKHMLQLMMKISIAIFLYLIAKKLPLYLDIKQYIIILMEQKILILVSK